jgi:Omp85 superfamily domain
VTRRVIVAVCAVVGLPFASLGAQQPIWSTCGGPVNTGACARSTLTRREREQAQALYNAPATRREKGPFTLLPDSVIDGALAVIGGPVRIAGTIKGALLVLNGDVEFTASARVTGDVAVLGGSVSGTDSAQLAAVRVEGDSVVFATDNGVLHLDAPFDEIWRLLGNGEPTVGVGLRLALTRTYNRVEGLPIEYGPRLRYRTRFGTVAADAFGVFRTGSRLSLKDENLGHNVRAELRFGRNEHLSLGGRLYDVVDGVESWQLSDVEVGLAAFLAHTDTRDYFERRGGSAVFGYRDGRAFRAALELSDEQWRPRATLDPFTLWRNNEPWRPNPDFDQARYQRAHIRLSYDTRTDPVRPRSGWWLQGEYEFGIGRHVTYGTELAAPINASARVKYGRAMIDLRRYLRLSRSAQLNARVIAAGWLHGDALPLQRRLSVSGPGALSGFTFRESVSSPDRLQCTQGTALSGTPALCDRIVLVSADYRHDIRWLVDLLGGTRMVRTDRSGAAGWVLFADAGRGWLEKPRIPRIAVRTGSPTGLNALHANIGAGLELWQGGVYVARALGNPPAQGVEVFVRLFRRF